MVVDTNPTPEYQPLGTLSPSRRSSRRAKGTARSPVAGRRKVRKRLSMDDVDSIKDLDAEGEVAEVQIEEGGVEVELEEI